MKFANSISDEHNPRPALRDIRPTVPIELPPKLKSARAASLRDLAHPLRIFKSGTVDLGSPSAIEEELSACEDLAGFLSPLRQFSDTGNSYLTSLREYIVWLRKLQYEALKCQGAISRYRQVLATKPAHILAPPRIASTAGQVSGPESVVAAAQKLVRWCDGIGAQDSRNAIENHLDSRISDLSGTIQSAKEGVSEQRRLGNDFSQQRDDILKCSVEQTAVDFARALIISRPVKEPEQQQHIPPPALMLPMSTDQKDGEEESLFVTP